MAEVGQITSVGQYDVLEVLGKGAFANVHLAKHLVTEEKVAIKIMDKRLISDDYVIKNLHREAAILSHLYHPNVIRLLEVYESDDIYCLITERAKIDLLQHLCNRGVYSEQQARKYIRQLISAVDHLHRNGIVHRDLKMENLMLDSEYNLKLIDFGLSNDMTGKTALETQCGSMAYSAPELLCKKPYGKEVDVWSIGVCLYVLLTGKLPFPSDRLTELHALMLEGAYTIPDEFSLSLKDLMARFFQVKPHKRITIDELATHEWILAGDAPLTSILNVSNGPPQLADIQVGLVQQMVRMGVDTEAEITHSILRNTCNRQSATYHLLISRTRRLARDKRRSIRESEETSPALPRSISQKSIRSTSSSGRRNSNSMRRSDSQPDDLSVAPRRPPSSRRDEASPTRRNSGNQQTVASEGGARRMSITRRSSRISPNADTQLGEYDDGEGQARRSSMSTLKPRPPLSSSFSSSRLATDPYLDSLEVMTLCLTHRESRDGDWERQLERAAHRALLSAPSAELIGILRSHGWDGIQLRRLRDPSLLCEQLETLVRTYESESSHSSTMNSPLSDPSRTTSLEVGVGLDCSVRSRLSRDGKDLHGLAMYQDGEDFFGFDPAELEATTQPFPSGSLTPRTSRPSSALREAAALPPIVAGPGSLKPRPLPISTDVDSDLSKHTRRLSFGHERRGTTESRLVPPSSSHPSRPGTAATSGRTTPTHVPSPVHMHTSRPVSPTSNMSRSMNRTSFSIPLSSGPIKFKRV